MIEMEKIQATCRKCHIPITLEKHPECPELRVQAWLLVVVCNRCGDYLERYRALDKAVADQCTNWQLISGGRNGATGRELIAKKLSSLTREFNHLLTTYWRTDAEWSEDFVDLLLEKPDKSRIAMRLEERNHRRAREIADREAARQPRLLEP